MPYGRARRTATYGEFWPGYVDVLSTLLLVVTFLLSVFMVAQFYVSQEVSGKDSALKRLTRQIAEITNLLSLEKGRGRSLEDELASLQASLATLRADNDRLGGIAAGGAEKDTRIAGLSKELSEQKGFSADALARVDVLNQQLIALRRQLSALQEALGTAEAKDKEIRPAFPTSAPASTSPSPAKCRSCSVTGPTFSAGCVSCSRIARTFAWSATASCSNPRCCSPPARPP